MQPTSYQVAVQIITSKFQCLHQIDCQFMSELEIKQIHLPKPASHHQIFEGLNALPHVQIVEQQHRADNVHALHIANLWINSCVAYQTLVQGLLMFGSFKRFGTWLSPFDIFPDLLLDFLGNRACHRSIIQQALHAQRQPMVHPGAPAPIPALATHFLGLVFEAAEEGGKEALLLGLDNSFDIFIGHTDVAL